MRIGIVNDSVMACEVLRRVVLSVPGQEVAWIARDGEQAVAMTRADGPDVILMDLFMPGTDGGEVAGAASLLRKIDVIGRLIGKTPPHTTALSSLAPIERPAQEPALHPLV